MKDTPIITDPFVGASSGFGAAPDVDESTMTAENRVVQSVEQAVAMTEQDIQDARKLVVAARRITAKKQGAPPYNPATLKAQGKNWKRNISTRFFQKELNRAAPRLYMPVLNASTMTAASLPAGWVKGQDKTKFFRDTMTAAFRGWRKNDMFWRGLAMEVVDYGFAFTAWTDPYEWRPHMCRMDRGFVPRGTEVMDDKIARFTLKWPYRPDELLQIVRKAIDAGSEFWKKDAVAAAVDSATLPSMPQDMTQLRKWEELIREQSWDYNYSRGQRMIETRHLYVLEFSGKVSHYILWPDGPGEYKLLFEHLDEYESTDQCVIPLVFGYGDGTIAGSWGCGQLLYDLAAQVEKIRCDSIDNLLNSNKVRLQVPNAKDAATAQLLVNDTTIIATGAQFAQNVGGISGNPDGYMVLDGKMTEWAQEIVGSYLPPIPLQPSDIKASQVNAAIAKEAEVQKDVLECWLKQVALVIGEMTRRMLNPDSDDDYAQAVRSKLLGEDANWFKKMFNRVWEKAADVSMLEKIIPPAPVRLTEEELQILVHQPVVQSVTEFTEFAASQRAAFAASVQNNPLFNQTAVARFMAGGVPNAGAAFVSEIVVPEGDTTSLTAQQRQQQIESSVMLVTGQPVPVVITDAHVVHYDALVKPLEQAIMGGLIQPAQAGLQHLSSHYAAGVQQKIWPPERINTDKAQLARLQKALEAKMAEVQQQQAMQQMGQQRQGVPQPGGAPVMPPPTA
jgi:hypothetical protein